MRKKLVPAIWSLVVLASVLAAEPGAVAQPAPAPVPQSTAPRAPANDVGIAVINTPTIETETEPNNTPATADSIAAPLTASRYVVLVGANIFPGGDVDFYSLTAPAGSRIWIETDTGGPLSPGANSRDTLIDLIASDGVTVIETDDEDGIGNGGDGTTESASASLIAGRTLTAGGTYFIRVRTFTASEIIGSYRVFFVITTAAASAESGFNGAAVFANAALPVSAAFGLRSGAIDAGGDVDYYSVAATAGSTLFFAADADLDRDGTGTDLVLELLDPNEQLLLAVDSSFSGSVANPAAEGSNFLIPRDGRYFIRVRHYFAAGTGSYHLMTALSVPSSVDEDIGGPEFVNFTSTAQRCAIIAGTLAPGGDVDFFQFVAPAGSRVWIATDTGGQPNSGTTSRDTVIDLIASDGVTVIESDDEDGIGNGGDGTIESGAASIIGGRTLVAGGSYYLRVRAFSATGIVNPYKLFIVLTNTAAIAEVEGNDTAATANRVAAATSPLGLRAGAIGAAGDEDYYSIHAAAGSLIYFNVDGDPERDGTGTDLVVEVRSPADVVLLYVDSSFGAGSLADPAAEGGNFMVADIAGTYYLRVRHYEPGGTGTYHLMAMAASGNGFPDFTDPSLTATVSGIRAVHVMELRSRIAGLRARFGLGEFPWSHPSLLGGLVAAVDMTELRTALQQAYSAAGRTAPAFTDPVIVPRSTLIKAAHITQLRDAVIELEGS